MIMRKLDLIEALAKMEGNPVMAVYDGMGMLSPVRVTPMDPENRMRIFDPDDTAIICMDDDARAELIRQVGRREDIEAANLEAEDIHGALGQG